MLLSVFAIPVLVFIFSDLAHCPDPMSPDQRFMIFDSRLKGWQSISFPSIPQGNGHVSQVTPAFGPFDWAAFKTSAEFLLIQAHFLDQIHPKEFFPRLEFLQDS